MSFAVYIFILPIAGALGVSSCHLARRRIAFLRSTGETFAHRRIASSQSALLISCVVVIGATQLVAANVGMSFALAGFMCVIPGCVYLSLIDIDTHLLPWSDCILVGLVSAGLLTVDAFIHSRGDVVVTMAVSALLTWGIFRCLEWMSRGDLGGGDVVLATVLAAVLGSFGVSAVAQALVVAVVATGGFAVAAMVVSRFRLRTAFAFGPFLVFGALIVMMTADPLWVVTQ